MPTRYTFKKGADSEAVVEVYRSETDIVLMSNEIIMGNLSLEEACVSISKEGDNRKKRYHDSRIGEQFTKNSIELLKDYVKKDELIALVLYPTDDPDIVGGFIGVRYPNNIDYKYMKQIESHLKNDKSGI